MFSRFLSFLLSLSALLCSVSAAATLPDDGVLHQAIFHPQFKSLQVRVNGNQLAAPVIILDSAQQLEIVFDEISDERRYMRYELIHCDARWRKDNLVDSEFLDGFNYGDVEIYDYSRATLVHYVNYRILIPNEQMRITASGNYIVRVYPEDNPDETLLQARFSVSEATMAVSGNVTSRTDIDTNAGHQQLELIVDSREAKVDNLYDDLTVIITPNGDTHREVEAGRPLRVQGTKAVYEHLRPLIFPAGNEWRRFETVSTRYPGIGVAAIEYHDPMYHFILNTDSPRAFDRYRYDQTQHGRFFIREYDSSDSDTEADYVMVDFSLSMPQLHNAEIYIDGNLTNRSLSPSNHMLYDPAEGAYRISLMLKQGAYNYRYLTVKPDGTPSPSTIEGDFYETGNEYLVKVYHRPRGCRYDRLVATDIIYSHP